MGVHPQIPALDPTVCSNKNSSCDNVCNCHSGYTGSECEIPICYDNYQMNQLFVHQDMYVLKRLNVKMVMKEMNILLLWKIIK